MYLCLSSIPGLGAPQLAYAVQQKHVLPLVAPCCLILAEPLSSFHFLSSTNSLVLLMQYSNVALIRLNLVGSRLPTLHHLLAALGCSAAPEEAAVAVGARIWLVVCSLLLPPFEDYGTCRHWQHAQALYNLSSARLCSLLFQISSCFIIRQEDRICIPYLKPFLILVFCFFFFLFFCCLFSKCNVQRLQQQQTMKNVKVFGISKHLFILCIYIADEPCPEGASWNYHASIRTLHFSPRHQISITVTGSMVNPPTNKWQT